MSNVKISKFDESVHRGDDRQAEVTYQGVSCGDLFATYTEAWDGTFKTLPVRRRSMEPSHRVNVIRARRRSWSAHCFEVVGLRSRSPHLQPLSGGCARWCLRSSAWHSRDESTHRRRQHDQQQQPLQPLRVDRRRHR